MSQKWSISTRASGNRTSIPSCGVSQGQVFMGMCSREIRLYTVHWKSLYFMPCSVHYWNKGNRSALNASIRNGRRGTLWSRILAELKSCVTLKTLTRSMAFSTLGRQVRRQPSSTISLSVLKQRILKYLLQSTNLRSNMHLLQSQLLPSTHLLPLSSLLNLSALLTIWIW